MGREDRRTKTWQHCVRAKRLWVRIRTYYATPDELAEAEAHPLGHFRKSSGAGCRGSKKGGHSPKFGSCCKTGNSYRDSVVERIAGRPLVARGRRADVSQRRLTATTFTRIFLAQTAYSRSLCRCDVPIVAA